MKRAYADTPEGQVHYVTEGSGEPLLLLHETPRSWASYAKVIPLLAKTHRVIAIDTPGFGNSDPPPRPFEIEDYAASVTQFLDSLGISKTNVMGDHTGSCIAVELAVRWPERVLRLILAGLPFWHSTEERLTRLKQVEEGTAGAEEVDGSHCTSIWQSILEAIPGSDKGEIPQEDLEYVARYTLETLNAGRQFKELHMAVFRYDPEPRLPLIQAPTLSVGIKNDSPPRYTDRPHEVKALIPRSSVAVFENADTRYKILKAEEVAERILRFLETPIP